MDIHEINQILRGRAIEAGLCKEWQETVWNRDLTLTELLVIYKRGIDFSLKKEWFDYGFIKKVFPLEELHENLIYIDEEVDIRDAESGTWVMLGSCSGEITFRDFSVGNVYLRHDSDMKIIARGTSKVFVSQYDDACAECITLEDAVLRRYDRRK